MEEKEDLKTNKESLVRSFEENTTIFTRKFIIILVAAVLLGGVSGYSLSQLGGGDNVTSNKIISQEGKIEKGTVEGSTDTSTFKDTAEGTLKEGGVDGEGAFHLERPGGISQNVYLTSSAVDLSKYVDKKVKVWGQTQKAQTAGWLMDVGRIEVL